MLMLALGAFLTSAPAAHAKVDYLSLSLDGQHWTPTVERPLFDASRLWVPGDILSVPVWIRNDSGSPADLYVDVVDVAGGLRIGRELDLTGRIDGRTVHPVGDRLLSDVLPAATPKRIDIAVELPFSAGNETQRRAGSFALRVTLEGASTPLPPPVTPTPSPSTSASPTTSPTTGPTTAPTSAPTTGPVNPNLPNTGAPQGLVEAIITGVALIALAGVLLVGRKRGPRP